MKAFLVLAALLGLAIASDESSGACVCPQQYYFGSSGHIASPNYPGNYCNSLKCTYVISGISGQYVKLTFTHFHTESTLDVVKVYDSNKADDPYNILASLSGYRLPPKPFYSGTNQITVTFQTDSATAYSGWYATYSSVTDICGAGAISTGSNGHGVIQSPDWGYNYPDNVDCVWVITAPATQSIRLVFNPNSATEQGSDFVTVTHDKTKQSFSGSSFQTVQTIGNTMTVEFTSDDTVVNKGFQATYTAFTRTQNCSCGQQDLVINSPKQTKQVASPNFNHGGSNHNYCNNANCTWYLQVPNGYKVGIYFSTFDLERGYDKLYLYDGIYGNQLESCTDSTCNNITSTKNQMTLQFVTDESVSGQGFSGTFYPIISL